MNFRLVDAGWDKVLDDALKADHTSIRIICPFIKKRVVERLLKSRKPKTLQVITRFCLDDFSEGVSDISALRLLLESGAQIRGVRNLHAKLYLFGENCAIVTSANLTDAALLRNHELGFVAQGTEISAGCREYFDSMWGRAGEDLQTTQLSLWEREVTNYLIGGSRPGDLTQLGDKGVDLGIMPERLVLPLVVEAVEQSFVKFFGHSANRADRSTRVLDEVRSSGCHWACTYPKDKRPRMVQDNALMFMSRLVREPDDILIYGRAAAARYQSGRDDASEEDVAQRDWKVVWPHYVRVHHAVFIAGSLGDCVSLNEMMKVLEANSFASTLRNSAKGIGNTDPRRAYMRQAAVELSPQGFQWINERFERACIQHGTLAPATMEQLDWPTVPN